MFKFTTRVINLFKKFGVWLPVVLTAYCMVRLVSVLFDPRNPKEEIHSKKTKYINFFGGLTVIFLKI